MIKYASRPLMADERKYTFRSCTDIEVRSGLIGIMTINMPTSYKEACKTWERINERLDTERFQMELHEILDSIGILLPSKEKLRVYYNTHLRLTFTDSENLNYIGMRIAASNEYAYLIQINPSRDNGNVVVYCYLQEQLMHHMRNALNGIRFIDKENHELCKIRDGGKITLQPCSVKSPITCRYIDPFTCSIGRKKWNLRDFADYIANAGIIVIPA